MKFKGFIFDLDGTLIDSRLDFTQIRKDLEIEQHLPILEEIEKWSPQKQVWAHSILDKHELRGAELSTVYPGVMDFLSTLKKENLPSAVFTRNSRKATELALKIHGFYFRTVITRDDAPPKPDPTGLLQIAKLFELEPKDILYVGDYLYDLQAGSAAGMPTALFLSGPQDFVTTGAKFSFQQYNELRKYLFP